MKIKFNAFYTREICNCLDDNGLPYNIIDTGKENLIDSKQCVLDFLRNHFSDADFKVVNE